MGFGSSGPSYATSRLAMQDLPYSVVREKGIIVRDVSNREENHN